MITARYTFDEDKERTRDFRDVDQARRWTAVAITKGLHEIHILGYYGAAFADGFRWFHEGKHGELVAI